MFREIICYERTGSIGGLWKYRGNSNCDETDGEAGEAESVTVMRGTVANSSKEMSAFSDFPPPPLTPNFMHHTLMYQYLESYAHHFHCLQHIRFHCDVVDVSRSGVGWRVRVSCKSGSNAGDPQLQRNEYFDAVIVCTGHHGRPVVPSFPGEKSFKGKKSDVSRLACHESRQRLRVSRNLHVSRVFPPANVTGRILHTHRYKTASEFADHKVLVVGSGNSGLDAAVELADVADKVYLSTRSGCWILPRLGFRGGRPYDTSFLTRSMHALKESFPTEGVSFVIETMLNRRFDHELFGLRPSHPLFHEHPTINDLVASKILCGAVQVKGDVERLVAEGVLFTGDSAPCSVDSIILATGYHIDFPFLSKELSDCIFSGREGRLRLFKYVFPILEEGDKEGAVETLSFVGVPNAVGPLFPVAEMQARWVVQVLAKKARLPSPAAMAAALEEQDVERRK